MILYVLNDLCLLNNVRKLLNEKKLRAVGDAEQLRIENENRKKRINAT